MSELYIASEVIVPCTVSLILPFSDLYLLGASSESLQTDSHLILTSSVASSTFIIWTLESELHR